MSANRSGNSYHSNNASCNESSLKDVSMDRRESSGSFDCIGMNTISYSRMRRENQMLAYNVANSTRALKYLSRWDRPWTKTDFPPPPPSRFSNKIVLIVDCRSREIIQMNDCAARIIFGREVFETRPSINSLFSEQHSQWLENAIQACETTVGAVIVATSDLINIVDADGNVYLVSAFVQKMTRDTGDFSLAMFAFERCHRFVANCSVDSDGLIIEHDQNMAALAGQEMKDRNLSNILNCISVKDLFNMQNEEVFVTGRNKRQHRFPMTIRRRLTTQSNDRTIYQLEVYLYTTISGLVIVNRDGDIVDANAAFLRIFLGHDNSEALFGTSIKRLIPNFYDMSRCNRFGQMADMEVPSSSNISSDINDSINAARLACSLAKETTSPHYYSPPQKRRRPSAEGATPKYGNLAREVILREAARNSTTPPQSKAATSTPASTPTRSEEDMLPGNGHYFCNCLHRDGSFLEAQCLLSQVDSERWALWLSRSFQDPHTVELYLDSVPTDMEWSSSEDESITDPNDFFNRYDNIVELQAGRLGPVFVSKRKSESTDDRYVAKFLTKTEMKGYDFLRSGNGELVAREALILSTISHKNIVKLVDYMEDEYFYQIVTECHGQFCDLVNFCALNPDVDEKLCAFIFEQLSSAVNYLHSNNIVHRNIRAENIVFDHHFKVKLIDFSYAHKDDINGLPFVGGLDYCPPEVLLGLVCAGKPMDVWSMGVALYMLMFGFLPFKEPYAIIRSVRVMPNVTSEQMSELFIDLFCTIPGGRITCQQLVTHPWVKQPVNIDMYKWEDVVKRGDLRTHLDYQALQRNSTQFVSGDSPIAYTGISPMMRRRLDSDNASCSILNRTIEEYSDEDEEELPADSKKSLSVLLRSLSDNIVDEEAAGDANQAAAGKADDNNGPPETDGKGGGGCGAAAVAH